MKKKIHIIDSGANEIVSSMADSLGVLPLIDRNEYRLDLPEEFGNGSVTGYEFGNGCGIVNAEYTLNKEFYFQLEKGIVHPLKLVFNTGGDYHYRLQHEREFKTLRNMETMIVASTPRNNHHFLIPSKVRTSLFSLEINRKFFEQRIADYLDAMEPELEELFRDVNGVLPFFFKTGMSYDISTMIEEFRNCEASGMRRRIYLEGKTYEILASFLQLYLDEIHRTNDRRIFRHNHLKSVNAAAGYIRQNLVSRLNVEDLAMAQGLSPNILQNGFRTLYGMSVNEFIQNERLQEAKSLLEEGELTVSEITYAIGLNSKSYLARKFSERFGMTPSEYRSKFGRSSRSG